MVLMQRYICMGAFSKRMRPSFVKGGGYWDEKNLNGDETSGIKNKQFLCSAPFLYYLCERIANTNKRKI